MMQMQTSSQEAQRELDKFLKRDQYWCQHRTLQVLADAVHSRQHILPSYIVERVQVFRIPLLVLHIA